MKKLLYLLLPLLLLTCGCTREFESRLSDVETRLSDVETRLAKVEDQGTS